MLMNTHSDPRLPTWAAHWWYIVAILTATLKVAKRTKNQVGRAFLTRTCRVRANPSNRPFLTSQWYPVSVE